MPGLNRPLTATGPDPSIYEPTSSRRLRKTRSLISKRARSASKQAPQASGSRKAQQPRRRRGTLPNPIPTSSSPRTTLRVEQATAVPTQLSASPQPSTFRDISIPDAQNVVYARYVSQLGRTRYRFMRRVGAEIGQCAQVWYNLLRICGMPGQENWRKRE